MAKKTKTISYLLLFSFFFIVSYLLVSSYIYGDQLHYRPFYQALGQASFYDVMGLSTKYLSAGEPLSAYVLWFGARLGIEKDLYISFLNSSLLLLLVIFLKNFRVSFIVIILILANYYILVLMTSAERLKISYIFLLSACVVPNYKRWAMLSFGILSHFQSLIILPSLFIYSRKCNYFITSNIFKLRIKKIAHSAIFLLLICVFLFLFWGPLLGKLQAYLNTEIKFSSLYQLLLLLVATLLAAKKKLPVFFVFIYFSIVILFLGGNRVNMIAFSAAVFFLVVERRLSKIDIYNLPFLAIVTYFAYKSTGFVWNIFVHGNGFYSGQ